MKLLKNISYLLIVFVFISCGTSKNLTTVSSSGLKSVDQVKAERIFFSGLKEKVKENYVEAVNYFEKAVKYYPIDAAYYEIALIKHNQRDFVSALKNIETALKIESTNKWYREFYAEMLSQNGKFDKAGSVYKKLREENPSNINYYYSEAYFHIKQNKPKDAIKVYNILEARIGIQEDISNEKYLLYMKSGNNELAGEELQKLSEENPDNLKQLNRLANFYLSNNEKEKAILIFEKILEENPNDAKTIMSLADYYNHIGDTHKYKTYTEKAFLSNDILLDTKIAILYEFIQQAEKDKSSLKEALEYVKLLVKVSPNDAKTWAVFGDIYNVDGETEKALEKYKKSLEYKKDVFSVWQQIFFIESDLQKYEDLISHTEQAKELFPNQSLVYFFNGLAYQQNKDYKNAIDPYKKGVKMAVRNLNLQSQFYSNIGECYNSIKEFADSDKYFDMSLELDPNNQYTLNNYAYYLSLRSEKLEKAKEMSLNSLELSPDNPTYLDTYAWILFKNKEYSEAYEFQNKAITLSDSPSAALFEHLGDILYKQKNIEKAVGAWKKAQEKGNNSEKLAKKIKDKKL